MVQEYGLDEHSEAMYNMDKMGIRLSAVTSGMLPVRLLFLALVCFLDCFSRSFASFIAALRALSSLYVLVPLL